MQLCLNLLSKDLLKKGKLCLIHAYGYYSVFLNNGSFPAHQCYYKAGEASKEYSACCMSIGKSGAERRLGYSFPNCETDKNGAKDGCRRWYIARSPHWLNFWSGLTMFHYLLGMWKHSGILKTELETVPNWRSLLNIACFAVSMGTYMNYGISSENVNSSQDIFEW